jgi:hypothetical protein
VKSKSAAKSQGRLEGNTDLWDGAPTLSHVTHNKIYNPSGEMPDSAAQSLYDAGLIGDPYPDTMWQAIEAESRQTRTIAKAEGSIAAQGKQAEAFGKALTTERKGGASPVVVRDLQIGDVVEVAGEPLEVADIDPDTFAVTLKDGSKFGVQTVSDNAVLYGELEPGEVTAPALELAPPETDDEMIAREKAEAESNAAVQREAEKKAQVKYGWQQKLTGTAGDIGQQELGGELGGSENLFGRAGIERSGEAGGVPQPGPSRVLAPGAVKGSGRYREVYRVNKEAGDKMNALAASRESADLRATIQGRKVIGDLTAWEQADLGRYLVSERLKTVNPDHPQILSPLESAAISRQPRIARALNRYKADVKPEIEALRKQAGLTAEAAAGKGREFISLVPATDEMLPEIQTPVGSVPLRFRSKTTRFARQAEGMAAKYETDLPTILRESYGEVTQKARLRDLYDFLAKKGLARTEPVDEINGQPAQPIAIGRAAGGELSSALPEVAFMPHQIVSGIRDIMERPPTIESPLLKAGKAVQRAITGSALTANPAELVNHMRRQLDIVAAQPAAHVPAPVRALEAVTPYFGPRLGTAIRAVTQDMSSPANQQILQDIFDAGGGSTRAFQEYQAKHIPVVKQLQRLTQKLLFGIPEGRGVSGWDLRMRVQMEKIRRAVEGNTDPQRIREFANQIGQYTSKPDKLIEVMRAVNPYSATSLPMRATELKQLVGSSGLKAQSVAGAAGLRAETLLRGVGGTLMALATGNYMLSGKWPWENDKGHEFDLNTGMRDTNGKEVYLKLRAIAPTLSRPVQSLSMPELLRERGAEKPDYLAAGAIGPVNQALSLVNSPLSNTLLTAGTGYAPYFTRVPGRPPSLYDLASTQGEQPTGIMAERGARQLAAAIQGVNPVGRAFGEGTLPSPLKYIERPVPGVEPFGKIFTSAYEAKPPKPAHSVADAIRRQKAAARRHSHQ